ncbi:SRPBCC family protein [Streptomyces paludis]|uniref:SRPBCC family protein n=1 Tax=Streptomyces paludis TaxID=2282738 RepID=A0A345I007_9ACTN|nr:SRPBCC family protein [Streptomyces paludis]AXG82281.1 SRPBCC family protein [Streptomyces paludis]
MSVFRIDRATPLPADEAWRRLTDWPAHGRVVPLTRITVLTPGPTRTGTLFTARTGLGPLGFDDPMEVVHWQPPAPGVPGHCRLEKRGRAVTGWAEIRVRDDGPAGDGRGARVCWEEDLRFAVLPRPLDPLTARAGRLVFGRAVGRLLRGGSTAGTGAGADAGHG